MTNTYEFISEEQSRAFWHHLLYQMGFDRMARQCSVKVSGGSYIITVRHEA